MIQLNTLKPFIFEKVISDYNLNTLYGIRNDSLIHKDLTFLATQIAPKNYFPKTFDYVNYKKSTKLISEYLPAEELNLENVCVNIHGEQIEYINNYIEVYSYHSNQRILKNIVTARVNTLIDELHTIMKPWIFRKNTRIITYKSRMEYLNNLSQVLVLLYWLKHFNIRFKIPEKLKFCIEVGNGLKLFHNLFPESIAITFMLLYICKRTHITLDLNYSYEIGRYHHSRFNLYYLVHDYVNNKDITKYFNNVKRFYKKNVK
jgi:hypothetical protein